MSKAKGTTASSPSPELQAVLTCQADLAQVRTRIADIEKALAQQQKTANTVAQEPPEAQQLRTRRDELLADAALGGGDPAELDSVQLQLSEIESQAKQVAPKAAQARQAIAGLQRRLQTEQETQAALTNGFAGLVRALIRAEAEQVAVRYLDAAQVVMQHHAMLEGLAGQFADSGGEARYLSYGSPLMLPCFPLEATKNLQQLHTSGLIFDSSRFNGRDRESWRIGAAQALEAMGVDLKAGKPHAAE